MIYDITFSVSSCSYRTAQSTAIDTVEDIAASHGDVGITEHISSATATIDTTTAVTGLVDKDTFKTCGFRIISSTDIHSSITCDITFISATKDIAINMGTQNIIFSTFIRCKMCRSIHKCDFHLSTDVHCSISIDITLVTTSIDKTDSSYSIID